MIIIQLGVVFFLSKLKKWQNVYSETEKKLFFQSRNMIFSGKKKSSDHFNANVTLQNRYRRRV